MSIIAESGMFLRRLIRCQSFSVIRPWSITTIEFFLQKQLLSFLSSITHVCNGPKYASLRSFHIFRGIVEGIVAFPIALQLGVKK